LGHWGFSQVLSPTFALRQHFENKQKKIDHLDLYRIQDPADLDSIGFWDIVAEGSLLIVEWPDRVPASDWPFDRALIEVELSWVDGQTRNIRAHQRSSGPG